VSSRYLDQLQVVELVAEAALSVVALPVVVPLVV
jgi:hypothetical protein